MPAFTNGTFLVDTGASSTAVDRGLIAPLGLTATGAVMCHTPTTGQNAVRLDQYDVMLLVPGVVATQFWMIEAVSITECDLSAQGIQGLIGRDVLDRAMLVYNGPAKTFTIAY